MRINLVTLKCPHCGISQRFAVRAPRSYDVLSETVTCCVSGEKEEDKKSCGKKFDLHQQIQIWPTPTKEQIRLDFNKNLNREADMADRMGGA